MLSLGSLLLILQLRTLTSEWYHGSSDSDAYVNYLVMYVTGQVHEGFYSAIALLISLSHPYTIQVMTHSFWNNQGQQLQFTRLQAAIYNP